MPAAGGGCTQTRCELRDAGEGSPPAPASAAPDPRGSRRRAPAPLQRPPRRWEIMARLRHVLPSRCLPHRHRRPRQGPPPRREAGRRWMRRPRRPAPCSIPARGTAGCTERQRPTCQRVLLCRPPAAAPGRALPAPAATAARPGPLARSPAAQQPPPSPRPPGPGSPRCRAGCAVPSRRRRGCAGRPRPGADAAISSRRLNPPAA